MDQNRDQLRKPIYNSIASTDRSAGFALSNDRSVRLDLIADQLAQAKLRPRSIIPFELILIRQYSPPRHQRYSETNELAVKASADSNAFCPFSFLSGNVMHTQAFFPLHMDKKLEGVNLEQNFL